MNEYLPAYKPITKHTSFRTLLAFALIFVITSSLSHTAVAQDRYPVDSNVVAEQNDGDDKEIARLQRGLHGMTMTFIRFAREQQIDAYETGRWTGNFLTRHADKTFDPKEFLAWMKDELAMHEVSFEVLDARADHIEVRRGLLLTREKLPWLYRYGISQKEYEDFYHGALVEIAKAYGVSYTQKQEGNMVLLSIKQ